MLLNNVSVDTDENKRKVYVGITRAKRELYIHYNNNIFKNSPIQIVEDNIIYKEPNEITLQLTHRDVFLDFFKDTREAILKLRSGDNLQISEGCLSITQNGKSINIVKFSKGFNDKLAKLIDKGYQPTSAMVRYQVLWKSKEDESETVIILPDIKLCKDKAL